jgi:hypothetical protein
LARSALGGTLTGCGRPLCRCRALAGLALNRALARLAGRTLLCRPFTLGRTLARCSGTLSWSRGRCGRALLGTNGGVYPGCG